MKTYHHRSSMDRTLYGKRGQSRNVSVYAQVIGRRALVSRQMGAVRAGQVTVRIRSPTDLHRGLFGPEKSMFLPRGQENGKSIAKVVPRFCVQKQPRSTQALGA